MSESVNQRSRVVSIGRGDSIKQAAALMLTHNVGCLIVNDEQGKLVGLVTERDIARHVAVFPDCGLQTDIGRIMTGQVVSCPPGIATGEARRIMTAHRIRHLPIIENGEVVGVLSARDLMSRQLLEDRAAAEEVATLAKCLKSIDLGEAAEIVATEAPKLFKARHCVLCLYGDGDPGGQPELVSSNRCPCLAGHLVEDGGLEVVDPGRTAESPAAQEEGTYYEEEVPAQCRSEGGQPPRLVLPLEIIGLPQGPSGANKRLSGYLCMCGLPDSTLADRELISYKARLTREIVVAHLSNATRYHQARLSSLTDALTGAGSRKLLEDKLQEEFDRARRYKRPFSMAIIDLDHFKMINDILGHAAGDDAMRKLAECMRREKRGPDVLARYGGDEFVILLPETKAAEASILLERIRAKVLQLQLDQDLTLSISCGIAEWLPDAEEAASGVMRRADLALYDAKNSGRNCVRLWNKGMAPPVDGSDLEIEKIKQLQRRVIGLSEKAEKLFMQSIWSLVQALEAKDAYARKHSENVMAYTIAIARTMELGPHYVDLIRRAAMIHDIGKIGIPDAVLAKAEHLTPHERQLIEQHPLIAVRILEKMSFLEKEIAIVRHHHEKWNGQGYPDGLARTAIPLGARIIAVADTFDALTSERSYHASRSVAEALHLLEDAAGYELDPTVVVALVAWVAGVTEKLGLSSERLTVEDLLAACEPRSCDPDSLPRIRPAETASPR